MKPADFPTRTRAAIFDFDETMIDLEPQHTRAYEELCRALGSDYAAMPESFRKGSGRRVIDDIHELRSFFGWTGDVQTLFAQRQRIFDRACEEAELRLMEGVERTVRALHAKGLALAVASSSVAASIEAILRRTSLRELFAAIVDGSQVQRGKPDPEAYLVTARVLGVEPGQCIVFEDSHVGVIAAKRAGMYTIGVRNPNAGELQDLSAADIVLSSMSEVDPAWVTGSITAA
ncbi:MAG TPA: HAD family phosphatase [Thermoanaerobaculia bacterium]|jgi:HAD superfamily hydrolase (TIGR01509 family)